jgi:hypothetical protein
VIGLYEYQEPAFMIGRLPEYCAREGKIYILRKSAHDVKRRTTLNAKQLFGTQYKYFFLPNGHKHANLVNPLGLSTL